VEIILRTRSNIRTGLHGLQFVLTYYDGERWQTDKQIVSVQVNNFIQRRPVLLGWLSIVTVLFAFLSLLSNLIVNFARVHDFLATLLLIGVG
jgi:uncharacterized protein involved in cysteine biosynthesis